MYLMYNLSCWCLCASVYSIDVFVFTLETDSYFKSYLVLKHMCIPESQEPLTMRLPLSSNWAFSSHNSLPCFIQSYCRKWGRGSHSSWPPDWLTDHSFTSSVDDLTLVLSSILSSNVIYSESTLWWRQRCPICELQIVIIEEPMDGDSSVRWNTGEGHRSAPFDCDIGDSNEGLCHRLCEKNRRGPDDKNLSESSSIPSLVNTLKSLPGGEVRSVFPWFTYCVSYVLVPV